MRCSYDFAGIFSVDSIYVDLKTYTSTDVLKEKCLLVSLLKTIFCVESIKKHIDVFPAVDVPFIYFIETISVHQFILVILRFEF